MLANNDRAAAGTPVKCALESLEECVYPRVCVRETHKQEDRQEPLCPKVILHCLSPTDLLSAFSSAASPTD